MWDLTSPLTSNPPFQDKWIPSFAVKANTSKEEEIVTKERQSKKFDWKKVLNDFLLLKKVQGKSERTVKDYDKHVNIFFKRFPNALDDLETCVMEYMSEDVKPATYNLRRAYLKCWFDYMKEEGAISSNPMEKLSKRKAQEKIIDIPVDVLQQLLNLPDTNSFTGLRDYSIMLLMLDSGIRPNEALRLKISDFDFRHYCVNVPAEIAKTRTARMLPLSIETIRPISKLIDARPQDWENSIPLFSSCEGEEMNTEVLSRRFEKYSKQLNVSLTPYALRHCFALYYLRNGGNALSLQKIMGHIPPWT